MTDLPGNVQTCGVKGHFAFARLQAGDADGVLDLVPVVGLVVTLTPSPTYLLDATATPPTVIVPDPLVLTTDSNGDLRDVDGNSTAYVIASDDPDLNPHDWTYTVSFAGTAADRFRAYSAAFPVGSTIDLSNITPIPSALGVSVSVAQAAEAAAAAYAASAAASAAAAATLLVPDEVTPQLLTTSVSGYLVPGVDPATKRFPAAVEAALSTAVVAPAAAAAAALRAPRTAAYLPAPSGGDDTSAVNSAIVAAMAFGAKCVVVGDRYRIDGQVDIASPLTLMGSGQGEFYSGAGTLSQVMINVTSSDVHIENLRITGPQFAVKSSQRGLNFQGASAASPIYNVSVAGCTVANFGESGIYGLHIRDFKIDRNTVKDCCYFGIGVACAIDGSIDQNTVRNITQPSGYSVSYGVFTSRIEDDSLSVSPRSAGISISGNNVYDVPGWDGINTHGGASHTIANNVVGNCLKPIEITGSDGAISNSQLFAFLDVNVCGNAVSSSVTDGSRAGIIFKGAGSVTGSPNEYGTGSCVGNIVRGHGLQSNSTNGAITAYFTEGMVIANNTIIQPSPNGIYMWHTNKDFSVLGNTVIDPWTTAGPVASAVNCGADYNAGYIGAGNRIVRSGKSAAVVASHGIFVNSNANTYITLGDNYMSAATTPVRDNGQRVTSIGQNLRQGPLADRPNAGSAYAGMSYLATDVSGGTQYRCVNTTGSTFVWQQTGAAVNAGSDDGVWRPRDNGMVAWAGDPATGLLTNQAAMASGTQYVSRVKVDQASAVTNLMFYVITAATSITEASGDLYDSTGARIATVDLSAAFASSGFKTVAFVSPTGARIPGETLYVGLRITFAGTAPVLRGGSTLAVPNANRSGANVRYGTAGTGVTSPQTSITPASIAAVSVGGSCHWVGIS